MARIYQGGQSEKRYQGNARGASFSPTQVTNKNKAIKQQGDAAIRDLQTQDRESKRNEQMSAVSRRAQDQTDQSELRISQQQVADQLRLQQQIDKNILDASQTYDKGELRLDQLVDRGDQSLKFSTNKAKQSFSNKLAQDQLAVQDLEERTNLGIEARALAADNALQSQALQAKQQVDNANRAVTQSIIQGLVDFSVLGIKHIAAENEKKNDEADAQQPYDIFFSNKGSVAANSSVIKENSEILASEVAFEQGVKKVAPGSPMSQQDIRSQSTDVTFARNIQQRDINNAAVAVPGELYDLLEDPNTMVMVNGQMIPFKNVPASHTHEAVHQVARQLTTEMGITKEGNAHASIMSYGRAIKSAVLAEIGIRKPLAQAKEKNTKWDAAKQNAASYAINEQFQTAWNTLESNFISSGKSESKGDVEIKDEVFKNLLERTDPLDYGKLRDVTFQKAGQNGRTRLGDQPKYEKLIRAAERGERSAVYADMNITAKESKMRVENKLGQLRRELLTSDEAPEVIRQRFLSWAEADGSNEATEAAQAMVQKGINRDPDVYRQILQGFRSGNPESQEYIDNALLQGDLSKAEHSYFKTLGDTSDVAQKALDESGINVEQLVTKFVKNVIIKKSGGNLKGADLDSAAEVVIGTTKRRMEKDLLNFARNKKGGVEPQDLSREAELLQDKYERELMGDPNSQTQSTGDISYDASSNTISMRSQYYTRGPAFRNRTTGEAIDDFRQKPMSEINDAGIFAGSNDLYLTKDNFLADVKAMDESQGYSARTLELSKKFNQTPVQFLKEQAGALGYQNMGFDTYQQALKVYQPDNMHDGKRLLVLQGFSDEGASYLAGSIMTESTWDPTSSNRGDGADGSDSLGLIQWNSDRVNTIEQYMGGTKINDASPGQQIDAMIKEMKASYKSSYRTLTTPGLRPERYEEAIKDYFGYGTKGSRSEYAQQLISSGGQQVLPGDGVRSFTGALTYQDNKQAYIKAGSILEKAGFQVKEQSNFGPIGKHASNSYHYFDEAFDITHQTGDYGTSIAKTTRLKELIRSLNLFDEIIGPGDWDPNAPQDAYQLMLKKHSTHLHAGGLLRPFTLRDIQLINSV